MTRALICSVLLLSLSCSSGGSNDGSAGNANSAGTGNSGGSSGAVGGSGSAIGGNAAGGSAGTGSGAAGAAGIGSGTAGAAGTGASGAGGTGSTAASGSVTQWGGDIARTAHYVSAGFTKANMAKMAADTFAMPVAPATESAAKISGEIAAIPLYLAGATAGTGEYIVATTQNDVYAFNEASGALVWKHNIGAPLGKGTSACGSPTNHGIVSTPVIDAVSRVIYAAGGMTDGHHEIHALNADTGMELSGGWPVDVSKLSAGTLKFAAAVTAQSQRSALSLVGGIVYVAFGGYCGDQGKYHGWVVGVNSKDPTQIGAWATMDELAGIWAPGGMASDGTGVFAVTGNVKSGVMDHSKTDSEELIRITGLGVASHATKDLFFPTEWINPMNSNDQDFGSSSPAVVTVPSSTPSKIVVAPSKPGRVYFVDAANLGGSLSQFADLVVADTGPSSQSVYTAPSAYQSASGVHVAITTGKGSHCPDPVGVIDSSLMSILLQPGATPDKAPTPKIVWCAKVMDDSGTTSRRSPISTNSIGSADPIVWLINGTKLNGFDGETGAVVFDGGTGTCGGVHYFTQAIVANGHVITAGETAGQAHLCSWSVHN